MDQPEVYLRLRNKVTVSEGKKEIYLEEAAQIVAPPDIEKELRRLPIHKVKPHEGNLSVIDAIKVIRTLKEKYPRLTPRILGDEETLIEIKEKKKSPLRLLLIPVVWLVLFLGSGLAIMNFHTDVSMGEVHEKIYLLLTGKVNHHPYILQIPYSIGIGVGMLLFFNHLFRKKLNEEPSPLELEIFLYQENVEKYAKSFENKENRREDDG